MSASENATCGPAAQRSASGRGTNDLMETPSQRPPERLRMESNTAHAANVYQLSPCGGSGGMQKRNSGKQHIDLALAEPIVQGEL